jgi:hypothetical protein
MPTAMTSESETENSHRGGELLLEFLNLGLQVRAGIHTGETKHGPAGEVRESRCTPGPGSPRRPAWARFWSPAPSRTWSPTPDPAGKPRQPRAQGPAWFLGGLRARQLRTHPARTAAGPPGPVTACPPGRVAARDRSRGIDLVVSDEHAPPAERGRACTSAWARAPGVSNGNQNRGSRRDADRLGASFPSRIARCSASPVNRHPRPAWCGGGAGRLDCPRWAL